MSNAKQIGTSGRDSSNRFIFAKMRLHVLAKQGVDISQLRSEIKRVTSVPPLSKFGVTADINVLSYRSWNTKLFSKKFSGVGRWYL